MKDVEHEQRAHAFLSASGSNRWMNCPPSAHLETGFKDESSFYAAEGTLAHEFAELTLLRATKQLTPTKYKKALLPIEKNELYSEDMPDEVAKYIDYVMAEFKTAKRKHKVAHLLIEEKVDLSEYIEDSFGTCDANIIAAGVLQVIDLKYGMGLRVEAKDNSQLKLYALGALEAYNFIYDIHTVKMTIAQPRLDSISTYEMTVEDLFTWAEKEVKPKAEMAFAGEGVQKAGKWCQFCKAAPRCATLAAQNLKIAQHEFNDPHLLSDKQLLEVYAQMELLSIWTKSVSSYILKQALTGKKWTGYKVVEGRSIRKWFEVEKALNLLLDQGFKTEDIQNVKIKGIGDIEKLVGKAAFKTDMMPFIIKPPGRPALVKEDDKRPEIKSLEEAKNEFK